MQTIRRGSGQAVAKERTASPFSRSTPHGGQARPGAGRCSHLPPLSILFLLLSSSASSRVVVLAAAVACTLRSGVCVSCVVS